MIALKISEVKDFMNKLLCQDTFDHFLLQEASIRTNAAYRIDGAPTASFYTKEEAEALGISGLRFLPYGMLRGQCYQLIKGKKTPVGFKFSLMLSPENLSRTIAQSAGSYTENDISAAFFNLRFQNGELTVTTGISYRIFPTDRTLEHEWDDLLIKFLDKHEISYEEL